METITKTKVRNDNRSIASKSEKMDHAWALVGSLDLSMVKLKLMDEEEGQGWTKEYTDYVEKRYKRYLCMICINPDGSCVPTKDIDQFWHQHILDTRAYAKDCIKIFGEFLHHFPYFGMRDEDDANNLLVAFECTKMSYLTLFEEEYCSEFNGNQNVKSSKCHQGPQNCHKCSGQVSCHKCTHAPPGSPDTIKCTKCQSRP